MAAGGGGAGHALARWTGSGRYRPGPAAATPDPINVRAVRRHFSFPDRGRIVLNNAASTQPPRELLALYQSLGPGYENVHRGQSSASQDMTARFEASYDTIAQFIGASGRASIALFRNATEAVNAVMYSLLTEFRDGDNVVTTLMEHNSNYVPWHAMCREILPRLGRRVQCRLARFDPVTGELDLDHLASLVDARTKLVCCTGASNFLGTRNPLGVIRALADRSGYIQPNGERRSWLLVDGAQLVPGSFVDVQAMDVDYLAFSFHKLLAPFGVGVLYAREQLLGPALPFLYGGDMIAEGRVFPNYVEYNALPWKYAAGTPNILGAVVSAQALRLLLDLALSPKRPAYFSTAVPLERGVVTEAMNRVAAWNQMLTSRALDGLKDIEGITIYGPRDAARRTSLVAFNLAGRDPVSVAQALDQAGIESRAGCHCATLAHHALRLTPPASCRLSFYLYNTPGEVDLAVDAVAAIAAGRGASGRGASGSRFRLRPAGRYRSRQFAPSAGERPRARPSGIGMSAITCPGCGAAAEVTERFTLASTDGPVAHVALSCTSGHQYRMAADKLTSLAPWPRKVLRPRRLLHTFPLCVHCLVNPAGFWVSGKNSSVVRRPWCLSCCQDLDRERCDVVPFGG